MGIDRIVVFGGASDIGVIWDEYDIIRSLSIVVDIQQLIKGFCNMSFYHDLNKFKDNTAAVDENEGFVTYGDIQKFSEEIGQIIPKRSLVFVYCENCLGSLCSYISCLYNSIVVLLLGNSVEAGLNEELIRNYKPSYLFVPKEKKEDFENYSVVYEKYGYCILEAAEKFEVNIYNNLALLLTTSGSTGSPKLVKQSYKNILSNAESISRYLQLDENERPITTLPMNYTYGLSIINSHFQVGATVYMTTKSIIQKEFWEFFKRSKATSFGGVPYTYEMLKKLRFFRMDLPSLKTMTQAGGKLSPELHKEFAEYALKKEKKFIVMYGQTEATARMSYLPYEKSLEKYGSMGIAIPGGKFELIDINGNVICEPDTVGELVYYGDNVTLGYAQNRDDLAKGDERNGKLVTGDMAKRDSDGYFYIVGRKKRFLKIFGNRVNLDECERLIKNEFINLECVCGGMDDKLCIYMTDDSRKDDVIRFVSYKTGLHPSAFTSVKIDEIPKNDAGKVLYKNLPEINYGNSQNF